MRGEKFSLLNTELMHYNKFDPTTLPGDKILVFIGKRGSGKTKLMKSVLSQMTHIFHSGIVFSETEDGNGAWGKHVPGLFIYNAYNPKILEEFVDRQRKITRENHKRFETDHHRKPNDEETYKLRAPPAFVVFEDCFSNVSMINKDKMISYVFKNGRHFNVSAFLTVQWLLDLKAGLREQIDYCFFTKTLHRKVMEKLFEHYFSFYPNFRAFVRHFRKFTENFGSMVLKTVGQSYEISENVFWYRAKLGVPFKLGCFGYRRYGRRRFNKHYDTKDDQNDEVMAGGGVKREEDLGSVVLVNAQ